MADETQQKVALITGITGQDGSYLAEFLLSKGYIVHGIVRQASAPNTLQRIQHLYAEAFAEGRLQLHLGDLTKAIGLFKIIRQVKPDEIYNLGSQTHISVSFELAEYTADVNAHGTIRLLDAIRTCGLEKTTKFYQASSSDLFGSSRETTIEPILLTETTPFYPSSPYGVAKLYAYWISKNYREAYDMFICNGILFNHESPRRGETFVTRKVTRSVAKIALGQMEYFELGNLDAKRDWGHAKDYVKAMWMMLQHEKPDDYVIATGETHSVRELVETAFHYINKSIRWEGKGENEVGIEEGTDIVRVRVDQQFYRPIEAAVVLGDASKAKKVLGWKSEIKFSELVSDMVKSDVALIRGDGVLSNA